MSTSGMSNSQGQEAARSGVDKPTHSHDISAGDATAVLQQGHHWAHPATVTQSFGPTRTGGLPGMWDPYPQAAAPYLDDSVRGRSTQLPPPRRIWAAPQRFPSWAWLALVCLVAVVAGFTWSYPVAGSGTVVSFLLLVTAILAVAVPSRRLRAYVAGSFVLASVVMVRESELGLLACGIVSASLLVLGLARARGWRAIAMSPVAIWGSAAGISTWLAKPVRTVRRPAQLRSIVIATGISLTLILLVGGLLASADAQFASILTQPATAISDNIQAAQWFYGIVAAGLALAAGYAAARPVQWRQALTEPVARLARPGVEWAAPLLALDVMLALFGVVQLARLFGRYDKEFADNGITYADRVHEGFTQLVIVTLVALAVLSWAGYRVAAAGSGQRRLLAIAGGGLVVLVLGLVASALRRLSLYEQAYGWTSLRVMVGIFELWLGVAIVLIAGLWLLRKQQWIADAVIVSAAATVFAIGIAGPDAIVAHHNVQRYHETGKFDSDYALSLSSDAVPALAQLPGMAKPVSWPQTSNNPWYAWNFSRDQAAAALKTAEPATPTTP